MSGAFLARETYQRQNRDGLPTAELLASGYVPNIKLELEYTPLFAINPRQDVDSSTVSVYASMCNILDLQNDLFNIPPASHYFPITGPSQTGFLF